MAWIKCKDRLPKRGKIVLVTDGEQTGMGFHGFGSAGRKITSDNVYWMRPVALDPLPFITHWQCLPLPPRKRKVK